MWPKIHDLRNQVPHHETRNDDDAHTPEELALLDQFIREQYSPKLEEQPAEEQSAGAPHHTAEIPSQERPEEGLGQGSGEPKEERHERIDEGSESRRQNTEGTPSRRKRPPLRLEDPPSWMSTVR